MTKVRGLVLVAGMATAGLMAAPPAGALSVTDGPLHHQTVRATISGAVTTLSVRNDVGDITVVPGEVTSVVAAESYNFQAPKLTHQLQGGVLTVSAACPRQTGVVDLGLNNCYSDLVVTVPQSVVVHAFDSVGDVRIRDLRGAETIRTSDGDIAVERVVADTLSAGSDTGEVRLVDVRARSLTLRNSDGDLSASLVAAPDRVVARNDTGDVNLTVPTGVYAVDVHTDYGSARVDGITSNTDASRTLLAHTSDGDIRISGR